MMMMMILLMSILHTGMTKWIDAWKKRGWLLANGNPVINREELELLDAEQKDIKVTYVSIDGKFK